MSEFRDELLRHKRNAEMQYVVSLYSDVEYYDEYNMDAKKNLTNPHWTMYYALLKNMVEKKHYSTIDEVSVELYMSGANEKLKKMYENAGGWATIEEALQIIETENIEAYYNEVIRYSALLKLNDAGFDIQHNWDLYNRLSYEELSQVVSGVVDTVFSEVDLGGEKVKDIKDGIKGMIDEADKGVNRGLPVGSRVLNSVINGQTLGNITMVGGASGIGKTFTTLCQVLPSVIKEKEPLFVMCNEEDLAKWQKEILTWIINNPMKSEFIKSRFYQGGFTKEERGHLDKAVEYLEEMVEDGLIRFVNFETFSMAKAIKLIRRYSTQYEIKYFVVDTLKLDNDIGSKINDNTWLLLQQNMVKLYNTVKPTAKNVHVWVTYQLNKSVKTRYLDQSALGISKNVADVVSTLLLIRDVLESEKGANGLTVKKQNGTKVQLSEDEEYMVVFIDKNRQGSTSNQVVWRVDKGRNIIKDVGFTKIAQDY